MRDVPVRQTGRVPCDRRGKGLERQESGAGSQKSEIRSQESGASVRKTFPRTWRVVLPRDWRGTARKRIRASDKGRAPQGSRGILRQRLRARGGTRVRVALISAQPAMRVEKLSRCAMPVAQEYATLARHARGNVFRR
jgi:hypothetical protein